MKASSARAKPPPRAEFRAAVQHFLHNLYDLDALSDSLLLNLAAIQDEAKHSHSLFALERAGRDLLVSLCNSVAERLPADDKKLMRVRLTIEALINGKSIAQLAREQHCSREYWSRTYMRLAVDLITREIISLDREKRSK